jgi:ABC-type polysaccharide/polyol phosphate transport system ATPase subunit
MNNIAIKLENITMEYRMMKERVDNIKEFAIKAFRNEIRYNTHLALSDVSLEIFKGERIGIIGPNGAGKSTLLKIICGIIKPTIGNVKVSGDISPLLELGVGFNPEFSGFDNIYLYGAYLGYRKKLIDDKLESIIQMADLGEFLYEPVKNYSSGMRARLGFAISTQIDPEILVLDEILGVGDEKFKKKSVAVIDRLVSEDRTVILVSHNLEEIKRRTDRVIWLENGKVISFGKPADVCRAYKMKMVRSANSCLDEMVVHIGLHKTASSSIQATLNDENNRQLLSRRGNYYPHNICGKNHNHSDFIYTSFSNSPEEYLANIIYKKNNIHEWSEAALEKMYNEAISSSSKRMIISGEDMSLLDIAGVKRLKDYLGAFFSEGPKFRIIVYTREIGNWAVSRMQEEIKYRLNYTEAYVQILNEVNSLYQSRIGNFIEVFGENCVEVYKFEDALDGVGGPVGHFLNLLGYEEKEIGEFVVHHKNAGLSDIALDIISFINDKTPLIVKGDVSSSRYYGDTKELHKIKGGKFSLPLKALNTIRNNASDDFEWLKEAIGIEYTLVRESIGENDKLTFSNEVIISIEEVYDNLSTEFQKKIYDYVSYKAKERATLDTFQNIELLQERLKQRHVLVERNEEVVNCFKERLGIDSTVQVPEVYKFTALFLQGHNNIEAASYFMNEARKLRPSGPFINSMCEHYKDLLRNNSTLEEVVLHIGIHKTASSSIQATLHDTQNKKLISTREDYYPSDIWKANHSYYLYSMFCDDPDKYHGNIWSGREGQEVKKWNDDNMKLLEKRLKESCAKRLILSAEDLSVLTKANIIMLRDYFLNQINNNIKFSVIVYTREYSSWVKSIIQELIKQVGYDYAQEHAFELVHNLYMERIQKFIEVFGKSNVSVYKFEDALKNRYGPVGHFLFQIGYTNDEISKFVINFTNQGVSQFTARLLMFINENSPLIHLGNITDGRFAGDVEPFSEIKGKKFDISKELKLKVNNYTLEDASWLKDNVGITYETYASNDEGVLLNDEYEYTDDWASDIKRIISILSPKMKLALFDFLKLELDVVNFNESAVINELIDEIKLLDSDKL